MTKHEPTGSRPGWRAWIGLLVLGLPTMLLSLDLSVLFLAVPHLSADLGATTAQQLWITDIYVFMTAGFLITAGRLGDRVGRRRLLLAGALVFGVVSVVAAYAPSAPALVASRGILGVAGATLLPSTLALLRTMFATSRHLAVAIAGWTTAYMAGVALGPVVGGLMLQRFWWGSVFLLALPIMAVLLVAGPRLLPEARDPTAERLDLPSVALSLGGILPIVYGLKVTATAGVDPVAGAAVLVGVVVGARFLRRQRRLRDPLLDLAFLRLPTVRVTLVAALLVAATQAAATMLVATSLQLVHAMGAMEAGLWLLVPSLVLVATVNVTPPLTRRLHPATVFAAGLAVAAVGHLVLSQVGRGGFGFLIAGIVVVHAGIGPAGALINQLLLSAAPQERAGSAASLASTSGELGIAVGIATLGSLGAAVYSRAVAVPPDVPAGATEQARESLVGAVAVADGLPDTVRDDLLAGAQAAFSSGLAAVAALSAAIFVVLTVVYVRVTRRTALVPD